MLRERMFVPLEPLLLICFNFNSNRSKYISNYVHYKVWGEITCLLPDFNGANVEVWEWISNLMPCDYLFLFALKLNDEKTARDLFTFPVGQN